MKTLTLIFALFALASCSTFEAPMKPSKVNTGVSYLTTAPKLNHLT